MCGTKLLPRGAGCTALSLLCRVGCAAARQILRLAVRAILRVEPARELAELAMNGIPKRSGVRRQRRQKLHRDVVDVSSPGNHLAPRHLYLVVVLAPEQVHPEA